MYKYILLVIFMYSATGSYYYTGKLKKFEACKGPKRRNCSVLKAEALDDYTMHFDLLVKETVALTVGKITAIKNKQDEVVFHMKKPCDHYFVREMFKRFLKVTDDCVIRKNHYVFTTSLKEHFKNYSPTSEYALGDLAFHTMMYGKDCNVICTIIHMYSEHANSTNKGH